MVYMGYMRLKNTIWGIGVYGDGIYGIYTGPRGSKEAPKGIPGGAREYFGVDSAPNFEELWWKKCSELEFWKIPNPEFDNIRLLSKLP